MTTNKSNTTSAKSATSRKYPALATYLKRVGGLAGLGHTAQEMSFEVFEAVRKEVTAPKFSARTVVSTTELTPEVKALVESVCTDKNHPWYVRKQVIRFFSTVCRFPLTAEGKWKEDDLVVKKITSIQGYLTNRAKGYNKKDKEGNVTHIAPWAEYPVILQEVEKINPKQEKTFKPAKDMLGKLITTLTDNAEKIEGSVEYANLLGFVQDEKEVIDFIKSHNEVLEELKAKMKQVTK